MTMDGTAPDWTAHIDEETKEHGLMAYSSGSDSEVCFSYKCKHELDLFKSECEEKRLKLGIMIRILF